MERKVPQGAPQNEASHANRIKDFEAEKERLHAAYQLALRAFSRTHTGKNLMGFYGFKHLVYAMSMVFTLDFSFSFWKHCESLLLLFSLEEPSMAPKVNFSGHDIQNPFMQGMDYQTLREGEGLLEYTEFRTVCGKIAHAVYLLQQNMDEDFAFIHAEEIQNAIQKALDYSKKMQSPNYERLNDSAHDDFLKRKL
jgi:hypothetical protein